MRGGGNGLRGRKVQDPLDYYHFDLWSLTAAMLKKFRIRFLLTLAMTLPWAPVMASPQDDSAALAKALTELTNEIKSLREDIKDLKTELQQQANTSRGRRAPAVSLEGKEIHIAGHPALGSDNAKVAIVEFSDYQCPFCRKFHIDTFPALKHDYIDSGKVKFVYFDFPLPFHSHAEGAAVAARCAGEQKRYWDMHNWLFSNQNRLTDVFYRQQAAAMGLDSAAFSKCLSAPGHAADIGKSMTLGRELGISGTPAFYIGHMEGDVVKDLRLVSGAKSIGYFNSAINALSR